MNTSDFLDMAFQHSPSGVLGFDLLASPMQVVMANPAAERLTGLERKALLGSGYLNNFLTPAEAGAFLGEMSVHNAVQSRYERLTSSGARRVLDVYTVKLPSQSAAISTIRDVTETVAIAERQARYDLERQQQEVDIAFENMRRRRIGQHLHEMNNALASVTMAISCLEGVEGKEYLAIASAGLDRAKLALSNHRLLMGGVPAQNEPLSLDAMTELARTTLSLPLVRRDYRDVTVYGTPVLAQRAILEILKNAGRAAGVLGQIDLATDRVSITGTKYVHPTGRLIAQGDYGRLIVSDSGPGMSTAQLADAFETDIKARDGRMRESVGLGMTQALMRQQDGYISVNSLAGKGTAVELYFPLVSSSRRE